MYDFEKQLPINTITIKLNKLGKDQCFHIKKRASNPQVWITSKEQMLLLGLWLSFETEYPDYTLFSSNWKYYDDLTIARI